MAKTKAKHKEGPDNVPIAVQDKPDGKYIYLVGFEVSLKRGIVITEIQLNLKEITSDKVYFDFPKENQIYLEHCNWVPLSQFQSLHICSGRYNYISDINSSIRYHTFCREVNLQLAKEKLSQAVIEKFAEISETFYDWRTKLNNHFKNQ
ncbi:MAG: hypothetical protein WCT85_03880 [Parachlamydiales bacterium]|jgi:hypothetical protein